MAFVETWPAEKVEELTRLYAADLSSSQIAELLGDGLTRNAVIGKIHRLGLTRPKKERSEPPKRIRKPRKPPAIRLVVFNPEPFIPQCVEVEPLHLTVEQLEEHHCRGPYGDGPFTFCGRKKTDNSSYCPMHERAFLAAPQPPRRPHMRFAA